MHSVLVVDDEPFVRLSLASLRTGGGGFDFPVEAGNGAEALAVLADTARDRHRAAGHLHAGAGRHRAAAAPGRRRTAARGGPPAVMVLSAYDEYHLVRSAFTLGARDYLLKSELEGETGLLAMLGRPPKAWPTRTSAAATVLGGTRVPEATRPGAPRPAAPAPRPRSEEVFAGLGLASAAPFRPCALGSGLRGGGRALPRRRAGPLPGMVGRSLAQVLARRGGGEVVMLAPGPRGGPVPGRPGGGARFLRGRGGEPEALPGGAGGVLRGHGLPAPGGGAGGLPGGGRLPQGRVPDRGGSPSASCGSASPIPSSALAEAPARPGVSKNHLSWEFARETGETFTAYLAGARMAEAKRLLSSTTMKVYEVGEQVGYLNVEHFSRMFKKLDRRRAPARLGGRSGEVQPDPKAGTARGRRPADNIDPEEIVKQSEARSFTPPGARARLRRLSLPRRNHEKAIACFCWPPSAWPPALGAGQGHLEDGRQPTRPHHHLGRGDRGRSTPSSRRPTRAWRS